MTRNIFFYPRMKRGNIVLNWVNNKRWKYLNFVWNYRTWSLDNLRVCIHQMLHYESDSSSAFVYNILPKILYGKIFVTIKEKKKKKIIKSKLWVRVSCRDISANVCYFFYFYSMCVLWMWHDILKHYNSRGFGIANVIKRFFFLESFFLKRIQHR